MSAVADEQMDADALLTDSEHRGSKLAPPAKKKKGGGQRPRNELLDALAVVGGGRVEDVTSPMWGEAAKALKDIREVCPEVTPEMIRRTVVAQHQAWPNMSLSPSSVAKHWAKFGAKKEGGAVDAFVPGAVTARAAPQGWRRAMVYLFGEDWSEFYPAFETMLPSDQRQVMDWLTANPEGGDAV